MKKKIFAILTFILFLIILFVVYSDFSVEGDYPSKPVVIAVHSQPGSGVDLMARKVAEIARQEFGVTMVVENHTGTQGIVAMQYVLNSPRDGYTILAVTKSFLSTVIVNRSNITMDDFHFFAYMVHDAESLIVNKHAEINTFEKLLADAIEKDGEQVWIGPGTGGRDHLMAIKTWETLGIEARWIDYRTGPLSILAMLRQEAPVYVGNPLDIKGREDDLANAIIAGPQRLESFPNVPTFYEFGYDLEEYMWRGFSFARGVPLEHVDFMEELFYNISLTDQWQDYLKDNYFYPKFLGYSEFQHLVEQESAETVELLREAGLLEDYQRERNMPLWVLILIIAAILTLVIYSVSKITGRRVNSVITFCTFLIGAALIFFVETTRFLVPADVNITSPALIPRIWIIIIILLSILLIYKEFKKKEIAKPQPNSAKIYQILGLMFLYFIGIIVFGYYISTFIFLVVAMYILHSRDWLLMITVSCSYIIGSYIMFQLFLNIHLPLGIIFG